MESELVPVTMDLDLVYNSSLQTALTTSMVLVLNSSENSTIPLYDDDMDGVEMNCTSNCTETCTPLSRLHLTDVFTRMDIGNAEFWGSIRPAWLPYFIIYYVLFFILLVIMVCGYVYFLKRLRFFVFILILFVVWSCFSFVHHILLMYSIVNGSGVQLANAARALEIITSSSFMNFAILTVLSNDHNSYSLRQYGLFLIIPNYVITGVIMVISLSAKGTALTALIVLRSLIFISSIILVNLNINYKQCFKVKEHQLCHLLWTQKKILIIYPYFFISYFYFSYMLITIASSSSCIENVQLHRTVWFVFNCLLRICEVCFSTVYFVKIRTMFKASQTNRGTKTLNSWIKSLVSTSRQDHKLRSPLKSSSFTYQLPLAEIDIHNNVSSTTQSANLTTEKNASSNDLCESDISKQTAQVVFPTANNLTSNIGTSAIEIEPLFQNSNYRHYSDKSSDSEVHNVDLSCWSASTVTCSLSTDVFHSMKSIAYSEETLYDPTKVSSIINDGKDKVHNQACNIYISS